MKSQILLTRRFSHISPCPHCKGLMFHFIEEALMLDALTEEARKEIHQALIDGESFEDIEKQNPIPRETFDAWECAVCDPLFFLFSSILARACII